MKVYFCSICKAQLDVVGWGLRADCPNCDRLVPVIQQDVKKVKRVNDVSSKSFQKKEN